MQQSNKTDGGKVLATLVLIGAVYLGVRTFWSGSTTPSGEATPSALPATATPAIPSRMDITAAVDRAFSQMIAIGSGNQKQLTAAIWDDALQNNTSYLPRLWEYSNVEGLTYNIDDVKGRTVDLTTNYDLQSDQHYRFFFTRRDTWTFIHGSAGWLVDTVRVRNRILTLVAYPDGRRDSVSDSAFDPATQRVIFNEAGLKFVWSPNEKGGWRVSLLTTPAPAAPATAPPAQPADDQPVPVVAPAPPGGDCETVGVNGVYDDGKVLALDDGRHLRVADYDTPTSSVWVAPFDGIICDSDDKFINKDDNESVDLQP